MRREDEIEDRAEWAREQAEEAESHGLSQYWEGKADGLEWALIDNELEEKFGRRFESCPVKDADCDVGPLYGEVMLLAHMKGEHPDAYDAVTVDDEATAD